MRYTNVFCGRYSLRTGVKTMAWFYITLYFINCILNIASADIAASYRENVNKDFEYSRIQLLIYHYICLTFGIVTIFLSIILLVKFTESEDFLHFTVKWNISRCFIALVAIVYVAVEMNHILTVSLSTIIIMIDLCASAYFTGVVASYIKELEHPIGEVAYSTHTGIEELPVSQKKNEPDQVTYVNEKLGTSSQSADDFEEIELKDDIGSKPATSQPSTSEKTNLGNSQLDGKPLTKAPSDQGETDDKGKLKNDKEGMSENEIDEEKEKSPEQQKQENDTAGKTEDDATESPNVDQVKEDLSSNQKDGNGNVATPIVVVIQPSLEDKSEALSKETGEDKSKENEGFEETP